MVIVTGGAGFIGSCMVSHLNSKGITDIVIVDNINESEKWKYLVGKKFNNYIHKSQFIAWLEKADVSTIDYIIHLGACSATTETNFDYLINNNVDFSKYLFEWCAKHQKRIIYASSAATYGDGKKGYEDSDEYLESYRPLNGYGYSKHMFDLWQIDQEIRPTQCVGLKFFNVYGPNEYHKGRMASVVYHSYFEILKNNKVNLFKSYKPDFKNGEQIRDFVYVKDILKVIWFFIENGDLNGIYNVGTGQGRSFNDLAGACFKALGMEEHIAYIDMPDPLVDKYQYYTQASMSKLRAVGYKEEFYSLEEGVKDYICNYLKNNVLSM